MIACCMKLKVTTYSIDKNCVKLLLIKALLVSCIEHSLFFKTRNYLTTYTVKTDWLEQPYFLVATKFMVNWLVKMID